MSGMRPSSARRGTAGEQAKKLAALKPAPPRPAYLSTEQYQQLLELRRWLA